MTKLNDWTTTLVPEKGPFLCFLEVTPIFGVSFPCRPHCEDDDHPSRPRTLRDFPSELLPPPSPHPANLKNQTLKIYVWPVWLITLKCNLHRKKNNMGQTSEGCQSLEFGGWTLFNKVFQPPNMKSTIHVLTKFFRSIAFCCQLGLSSSVLRSKTPGKCELCLELCWMFCLTNVAFNDFFVFFKVYLTLFIWELTPSYSKGKKQKIHWKIFRSFTLDNDKSNISKSSTCFFHRIFTRIFAEITSRNPDLHLLQVRLPRNASLLGFLVQGLPERNDVVLRRRKPLSTPKLRPFDWPSSWSKMMTRAQRLTWFLQRNLKVIHWQISGEMKTL